LNWVQIGRVGREIKHTGSHRPDRLFDPRDLVSGEVVHHHRVALLQLRREHLLDVGTKGLACHRPTQDERCNDPACPQARHNGRGFPVTRRCRIDQALAPWTPAGAAGHRCGRGGLDDEDEALSIHVALPHPPAAAVAGHVGPILLGRSQALFLCDSPSRWSMSAMVESAFTTMPRVCRASRISLSVIPALLDTMARSSSACFSNRGRRWRTRCISLMAAEALTAKR